MNGSRCWAVNDVVEWLGGAVFLVDWRVVGKGYSLCNVDRGRR